MPAMMPLRNGGSGAILLLCAAPSLCVAQDFEPRRWTHLPVGTDVLGLTYGFTTGDLGFDPVLEIQDAKVEMHTLAIGYTRYMGIFERTTRLDVVVPVQSGTWDGLVSGAPQQVERDGFGDPVVRFSTNLFGAPAVSGKQFAEFRKEHTVSTTFGAAVELRLPLGEYKEDKLINLGQNRFAIAPQLGVLQTFGEWSFELTGSVVFYTDNDEFYLGTKLEQDPLYTAQAHVVRTIGSDWWIAGGVAYGWNGESTVDGVDKDDERSNLLWGTSIGFRLDDSQSLRLGYIRGDALNGLGSDVHTFAIGWSFRF
jgi:hypothetical protein